MSVRSNGRAVVASAGMAFADLVPTESWRDCDMLRSDRDRDAVLAECCFGWRWLRGALRGTRYLMPPERAAEELANGRAVLAEGTERMEPRFWTHHSPWNGLPIVPHVIGSMSGARRLLELIHQLGFSSASVYDTSLGRYRVVLFRTTMPDVLLADAQASHEDEAIAEAALQLAGAIDIMPDQHTLDFLKSPETSSYANG
ncbi:MAG: hypothetical protein H3C62_01300 [Gemmatimonadaceae bacterium]|nr:hypothetical protein [Gemmatimonadaceae bacterium]